VNPYRGDVPSGAGRPGIDRPEFCQFPDEYEIGTRDCIANPNGSTGETIVSIGCAALLIFHTNAPRRHYRSQDEQESDDDPHTQFP
jgi:hypothetical protein